MFGRGSCQINRISGNIHFVRLFSSFLACVYVEKNVKMQVLLFCAINIFMQGFVKARFMTTYLRKRY